MRYLHVCFSIRVTNCYAVQFMCLIQISELPGASGLSSGIGNPTSAEYSYCHPGHTHGHFSPAPQATPLPSPHQAVTPRASPETAEFRPAVPTVLSSRCCHSPAAPRTTGWRLADSCSLPKRLPVTLGNDSSPDGDPPTRRPGRLRADRK